MRIFPWQKTEVPAKDRQVERVQQMLKAMDIVLDVKNSDPWSSDRNEILKQLQEDK